MEKKSNIYQGNSVRKLFQTLFLTVMMSAPLLASAQLKRLHKKTTDIMSPKKVMKNTDANRMSVMKIRSNMQKGVLRKMNSEQHSGKIRFFNSKVMRRQNIQGLKKQRKANSY